ncbi:MAG TPA: VCBS repeat-containing protein, partial [Candidatus Sulfotelmatobacter sp.]|nr:VCBS repeat-containing protein [Candidatus Sulfotelmatobacter sp.]
MKTGTRFAVRIMTGALALLAWTLQSAATDFTSPKGYPVGTNPAAVVVGDFNGDGKLDLAVVNQGSGNVSILLGNGDGTFQAAKNVSVGGTPISIVVGDFNGDHKLDLVIGSTTSAIMLLGNGDGTFGPPTQINVNASSMLATDINQDGKLDLITNGGLLLGNGDGTFQTSLLLDGAAPFLVADFNGDGKPDVLTSKNVLLGNGDGTFQAPKPLPGANCSIVTSCFYISASGAADFNKDQKLDIALVRSLKSIGSHQTSLAVFILSGNGDGTFQTPVEMSLSGAFVASADFNGDGKPDLAIMPSIKQDSPLVYVELGKGDGTFPSTFTFDTGAGPNFLLAVDLNGDKLPDLIATDPADNTVTVMLNTSPTTGADLSVQ